MKKQKINRQLVFEKYDEHCAYCGRKIAIKDMQIDHIIPQYNWNAIFQNKEHNEYFARMIPMFLKHLTENDLNHFDNLNPACRVCNGWKSTYHLELFRQEIQEQTQRLNLRSSNYRMAKLYGLVKETNYKVVFFFETFLNKIETDDTNEQ